MARVPSPECTPCPHSTASQAIVYCTNPLDQVVLCNSVIVAIGVDNAVARPYQILAVLSVYLFCLFFFHFAQRAR